MTTSLAGFDDKAMQTDGNKRIPRDHDVFCCSAAPDKLGFFAFVET